MNILKLIVHGLAIAFVTNLTTKVSTQEIIILGFIASLAIFMDMVEIATGCVTLIGALGMKILD